VRRKIRLSCTALRCGGICGQTQQILDNLLGALGLLQNNAQILARISGSAGFSIMRSAKPRIAVSGLFTSWATPETSCPTAAIFSAWTNLSRSTAESVMSS